MHVAQQRQMVFLCSGQLGLSKHSACAGTVSARSPVRDLVASKIIDKQTFNIANQKGMQAVVARKSLLQTLSLCFMPKIARTLKCTDQESRIHNEQQNGICHRFL
jgi:hypothetical protein